MKNPINKRKICLKVTILTVVCLLYLHTIVGALAPEVRSGTFNFKTRFLNEANSRHSLSPIVDTVSGRKDSSIVANYNAWDGMIIFQADKVSIFQENASKFCPEDPGAFISALRQFVNTGKLSPMRVDIDITNICNNKCTMCFSADFQKKHPVIIPKNKMIKILEDLKTIGVKSLRLTGGGDPLTHPDFICFVENAYKRGFKLTLETNGDGLNNGIIETISRCFTHVRVSVDSAVDSTRQLVHQPKRKGATYARLLENLNKIKAEKERIGRHNELLIGATFLILPENYSEVYAFADEMKNAGVDWIAVRKTFKEDYYDEHPEHLEEALTQIKEARVVLESPDFKIVGPYGVSRTPKEDFKECLIAGTRLVIVANSHISLCCLLRSGVNVDAIDLGEIGEENTPVIKLLDEKKEQIGDFFNKAPAFCNVCIDVDFNHFLNRIKDFLEESQENLFRRMQVFPHSGSEILVGEKGSEDDIVPVFVPYEHFRKFNDGETISFNMDEIVRTSKKIDPFLARIARFYHLERILIRQQSVSKEATQSKKISEQYSDLDFSILKRLSEQYLKPTTQILVSGSVARRQSNFYSDFDLFIVEETSNDPGIGPFLSALKTVTGKEIQDYHALKEQMRHLYFNYPYDRMMINDTRPLDSTKSLSGILGISREEIETKDAEIALFFLIGNVVAEKKSKGKRDEDIDIKHDAGLFKYFSFFLASLNYLSIPLKNEDEQFIEEHYRIVLSFREKVQRFYGKETRIVGEKFLENSEDKFIEELKACMESTVKLVNSYVPLIFQKLQQKLPGLAGEDLMQILNIIKEGKEVEFSENTPEAVLSMLAAFSENELIQIRLYQIARKKSSWSTLYFLARNEKCPYEIVVKLAQMDGYVNRDIRYEAAKNPNADENVWKKLMTDIHLPIAKYCRKKLGRELPLVKRKTLVVERDKPDHWQREIMKTYNIVFNIIGKESTNETIRSQFEKAKMRFDEFWESSSVHEYNDVMTRLFRITSEIVEDPFVAAREQLNQIAIEIYEKNIKSFSYMSLQELLEASSSFNRLDAFLKDDKSGLKDADVRDLLETQIGAESVPAAVKMLEDSGSIGIVLDNYGELLIDLMLTGQLLAKGKNVKLFTRSRPFMISDVTSYGLLGFLGRMDRILGMEKVLSILRKSHKNGKLKIIATDAFSDGEELYSEDKMSVLREFEDLDVTIIKGDWNYKSAIGMKNWQSEDPLEETDLKYFPTDVIVLRVVKSPIIVGENTPKDPAELFGKSEIKVYSQKTIEDKIRYMQENKSVEKMLNGTFVVKDHHIHLAPTRVETFMELAEKNRNIILWNDIEKECGVDMKDIIDRGDVGELETVLQVSKNNDLKDYRTKYSIVQRAMVTMDDVERVAFEIGQDCYSSGGQYCEIRFAAEDPKVMIEKILASYNGLMKVSEMYPNFEFGFLITLEKSLDEEDAVAMIAELVRFKMDTSVSEDIRRRVVGVDAAGKEKGFNAMKFKGAFEAAGKSGLFDVITSHAGESFGSLEEGILAIEEAIEVLGVNRIGHSIAAGIDPGIFLGKTDEYGEEYDEERVIKLWKMQNGLLKKIKERGISIEINISSNLKTGAVSDISEHPISAFLKEGILVLMGTDAPLVANIDISKEIDKLLTSINSNSRLEEVVFANGDEIEEATKEVVQSAAEVRHYLSFQEIDLLNNSPLVVIKKDFIDRLYKETPLGILMNDGYKKTLQKLRKMLGPDNFIVADEDFKLDAFIEKSVAGGRKIIILDDGALSERYANTGIKGEPGKDYVFMVPGTSLDIRKDAVEFVDITALVLLGIGIMDEDDMLCRIAYKKFTGEEITKELLLSILTGKLETINILPRIIAISSDVDCSRSMMRLFEIAA
ncbi:MAG: ARMT1-like domain-containing protein [Candidatus Omnitrophota bacterium]